MHQKKIRLRLLFIGMFVTAILFMGGRQSAFAASANPELTCTYLEGSNAGAQNYSNWSKTVRSYLTKNGENYMRVQAGVSGTWVSVSYYDKDFTLLERKVIPQELPIFGGFYETAGHYYIVSGQQNPDESDDVEVYRLTKYDKNWNRISSCGLYGANTYYPFDAGSCRMDISGNYMIIRTCHEMYQSSDGLHHQANVTIQVNIDTMSVTDSYTGVMNTSYGYVSHSFNQFVKIENNKIVALDHGDSYPGHWLSFPIRRTYPPDSSSQAGYLPSMCFLSRV